MENEEPGTRYINLASGGLVSDVIRGIRSGCVETFRSYVNNGGENDDVVDAGPIIPNIQRVQADRNTSNLDEIAGNINEQANEDTLDNEDEFMAYLNNEASEAETDDTSDLSRLRSERVEDGDQNQNIRGNDEKDASSPEIANELRCKDDFTRMLAKTSSDSAVYAGRSGRIDDSFADLMHIDRLYIPIREGGIFKEGVRLKEGAKYVFLHPKDMLSHAYLQTHSDGVLHVLPGWDHSTFIHDISYRYHFGHKYVAAVPFLGGEVCNVRKHRCKGVLVCPASSAEYRNSSHCDVDREDKNILEIVETQSPHELAKKKVNGIYQSLRDREERRKGLFCGFPIPDPSDPSNTVACRGGPKLVLRRNASFAAQGNAHNIHLRTASKRRCDYFIGCSGYQDIHKNQNFSHYTRPLDIDNEMVPYLRDLMSGAETVDVGHGNCNFVREKNKGKKTCPKHGLDLIEVPCQEGNDEESGNHVMCTFEPVAMSNIPIEHKILYVSCTGEHFHPPPPPPEATVKKLRIVQEVWKETGIHCNGKLRKEVERRYLEAKKADGVDKKRRFNGSVAIPPGCIRNVLKSLRQPIPKIAVEVGELAILAAETGMPYVTDSKMVDGGHVFFLPLEVLLMYACTAKSFAGDATFQTVTEANRSIKDGRWYLYNIIAHASSDRLNGSGVVVMRVLMTGLTKGFYYAIWKYFFDSLIKASNLLRGEQVLDYGCIKVPYMEHWVTFRL